MLNDETFAILVLMALFTTFITTPSAMAIYRPARGIHRKLKDLSASEHSSSKEELRILACLHQRIPQRAGALDRGEDFESILAGVPRAADDRLGPGQPARATTSSRSNPR